MTGKRPITYDEASGGNLPGQEDRYRELAQRDALAKAIAIKKARGDYQPGGHVSEENFPPLTVAEHLEMIALGERIAHYYAHPSQLDVAVKAGATWAQIAAARGTDEPAVRQQYREWAEGQHRYAGMGDAEYAAAIARASAGEDGPHGLDDAAAGLEELAGLINFRVGAWQDFGYAEPPTPECATIPPLGEHSAKAIEARHEAIKNIDQLIARLDQVRAQLVSELRQDEDVRTARIAEQAGGAS